MTLLVLGCLWVVAATITALMPMRYQLVPGVTLLVAAPVLIGAFGWHYGFWPALIAALAFASMFRRPLRYFAGRLLGRPVTRPGEGES